MARYLERAEHTARLLNVALSQSLEEPGRVVPDDRWAKLLLCLNAEDLAKNCKTPYETTAKLAFDRQLRNSVISCIAAARENARQVRETISSEMWERINHLHLLINTTRLEDLWEDQPSDFFWEILNGATLFHGLTSSTLRHDESWHFIQIGRYIERTQLVAHLLKVHFDPLPLEQFSEVRDGDLGLIAILRSCTAFEAYCQQYTARLTIREIVEYLLLDREFPHAVHFSLLQVRESLDAIATATDTAKTRPVNRYAGRLLNLLEYGQVDEVLQSGLANFVKDVEEHSALVHEAMYTAYITYPIEAHRVMG
jgi:uncharacterized alpha-E superfamily protein